MMAATPKPKDQAITGAEFGAMRSLLAHLGVKQADIDAAIGANASGRTRDLVAKALILWLKARPKA